MPLRDMQSDPTVGGAKDPAAGDGGGDRSSPADGVHAAAREDADDGEEEDEQGVSKSSDGNEEKEEGWVSAEVCIHAVP